jgi:predicted nucleic acid-binding OB-fold protein
LAVTYVEKRIRDTLEERKSWCWRSWSAAISQIKRQAKNPLKEINYKTLKEIMRALKRKYHYTRFAKENY